MLHEVSHNLQSDLGLNKAVPVALGRRLLEEDCPPAVVQTWVRWNREIFADLSALLLGGPAVVGSLLDVVGRSPRAVVAYNPRGPHPTPWFRVYLSTELLRRMGFAEEAERYEALWSKIYPDPRAGTLPQGPGGLRSPGPIPPSWMRFASVSSPRSASAAWPTRSSSAPRNIR